MAQGPHNTNVLNILLRKYGIIGTAKIAIKDVLYDYVKGVDTYSPVSREEIFDADMVELSNRYVPSTFDLIKSMIKLVENDLDFKESNFIDFGSGKAKVCIGAAKFPFKVIKGIEYSKDLHEIAEKNIKKLSLQDRVELLNMDATVYKPVPEDRVLYFFNPFMGELLDNCLQIFATNKTDKPRYFLYANPVGDDIFCKYFRKLGEHIIQPGNVKVNHYTDH